MNTQERVSAIETELSKLKEEGNRKQQDLEGARKFILDQLNCSSLNIKENTQVWSDKKGAWLFCMNKKRKHFYYSYARIYEILKSNYNCNIIDVVVHSTLCELLELNGYATRDRLFQPA